MCLFEESLKISIIHIFCIFRQHEEITTKSKSLPINNSLKEKSVFISLSFFAAGCCCWRFQIRKNEESEIFENDHRERSPSEISKNFFRIWSDFMFLKYLNLNFYKAVKFSFNLVICNFEKCLSNFLYYLKKIYFSVLKIFKCFIKSLNLTEIILFKF